MDQTKFSNMVDYFVEKYKINDTDEYKNIFKNCLMDTYNIDYIEYVYNHGIKLFDNNFIIVCLKPLSKHCYEFWDHHH
jgi:hypothetical protein